MKVPVALMGALIMFGQSAYGQSLSCDLQEYEAAPGLRAAVAGDTLDLRWDGDNNQELQLRFTIRGGTPTIRDLAIKPKDAPDWVNVASDLTPEFRVVSGIRRMTGQQLTPLRDLGIEITPEVVEPLKWGAFWTRRWTSREWTDVEPPTSGCHEHQKTSIAQRPPIRLMAAR